MKSARIFFTAAEITPLAKAGGLGDVVGALPEALQSAVHSIVVAVPFHQEIDPKQLRRLQHIDTVTVSVRQKSFRVTVWKAFAAHSTVPLLLFKQRDFLSRGKIYDGHSILNPLTGTLTTKDSLGHGLRYLFFSYAMLAYLQRHPQAFTIVHGHDFHVAPLLTLVRHDSKLAHLKTIQTIHNLAYSGQLPRDYWEMFEPSVYHLFDTTEVRRPNGPRLFWLGLRWADAITTVSPDYAKEILTPEYGNDFELLLQQRKRYLHHILNGIDTKRFNPATDPAVPYHFSLSTLERRVANKLFLQRRCHLPVKADIPIIGFVTRLVPQKGVDLILHAMAQLAKLPVQFVICGIGKQHYAEAFQEMQRRYPEQWHFHNAFDTVFSQYVYAGADIFFMPSRHEPCGLAQLIAMRYGAVPVARATGGLKNTITDGYNGFLFGRYSSSAMLTAMRRAIKLYRTQPVRWKKFIQRGMGGNYGWKTSAKMYAGLYRHILRSPHATTLTDSIS